MTALSYVAVAGSPHRRFVTHLKRWLPKAVQLVPKTPAAISIALIGRARMAVLHKKFMNVAGPTDVLTFELEHDARGRITFGEVIVCVPYAQEEAKRLGVAIENEVLLYALHGVLHLSGFDDRTPEDHARMHQEEDRILRRIGIGTIFNRACQERGGSKIAAVPAPRQ
jgi:probable rRNA maturation factor